ncbi:MAG: histidine kinase dimerization/phospho-acceptor domain-containing protein [Meiothermus sp.]|uniref:sensor histidine kinase n=1 Tax=Meiothermus sp. TaxID=1955249 RepID=UPI00298ED9CA|nr:ATP-binding protein [Meiothermus sp.]MCX7741202.1 ATP-binding protein [Meiothermus sp.]MDW8481083.1 histidine kinase dimerization/phospho-acceptor domain-containing protein [Meiothermus sp.]
MSLGPLLHSAWEAAREGVLLFQNDQVLYLNPTAARLLGVEREKVAGRPLLLALRDHRLEALCRIGGEATIESRGRTLWAKALPGVLLLWDQSEEKNRLEALEESSRTLAHEFRTPVAGMLSLLEALQGGLKGKEAQEALQMLYQEAQRLRRLVEDLPLSRRPGLERTFALEELQGRLERFLAPLLAEKSAWIRWHTPHTVRANPDAVYQALLNLLENALKYGAGREIQVVSEEVLEGVRLEVRNEGEPLKEFERLFQAGQRGVHAANVRGTGLGLALVRRLAAGWGGRAYGRPLENGNAFGLIFPSKTSLNPESQSTKAPV